MWLKESPKFQLTFKYLRLINEIEIVNNGNNEFASKVRRAQQTNKKKNPMKKITQKMMAGTVAMAALCLGAGGLHAQVTQVITITATASVQGASSYSYNNKTYVTTYTTAAPTIKSVATKDILKLLATDYQTTFPSGAKLVMDGSSGDVEVVDKSGNLLQDVSGIMSFSNPGNNNIQSGKSTSQFNLGTFSNDQLLTLNFNDTALGGPLQFYMTGIGTGKKTDTTPNKTGAYTETDSGTLSSATGEGTYNGSEFICSGNASASGKATLTAQ